MAIQKYAVVDASGNITNTILWDGGSEWSPPANHTTVQLDNAAIGGTYIGGVYTAPATPPQPS